MSTLNLENIKHPDSASNNISVTSTGRVGIGTASPLAPLTVKTATDRNLSITSNGVGNLNDANSAWQETQFNGNPIIFGSGQFGTERMRIDSAGRVTMPYQPMFNARVAGSGSPAVSGGATDIIFADIDYNVGNHFNSTTGLFTAPVTGKYMFNLRIYFQSSGLSYVGAVLRRSDGQEYYGFDGGGPDVSAVVNQMTTLSAGDTVKTRTYPSANTNISAPNSWFSGYLIG